MAVSLVCTGEHYVVDVVAGWLTACAAVAVGAAVHQLLRPRTVRRGGSRAEPSQPREASAGRHKGQLAWTSPRQPPLSWPLDSMYSLNRWASALTCRSSTLMAEPTFSIRSEG